MTKRETTYITWKIHNLGKVYRLGTVHTVAWLPFDNTFFRCVLVFSTNERHSSVNKGNPLSISRLKRSNRIHTNMGNRQGIQRSESFGVPLDFGSGGDTYMCSTSIKRIAEKHSDIIVRLYKIDTATQSIIPGSLATVTWDGPHLHIPCHPGS